MQREKDKNLDLLEATVEYLDCSGNLQILKDICEKYLTKDIKTLVYTFRIFIDLSAVFELNVSLGHLLISSPPKASALFQQVVYLAIGTLRLLPVLPSITQISVHIRITSLPKLTGINVILSYKDLIRCHSQCKYINFSGIVIGQTATARYTQGTQYICPDEECEGHVGNHFMRVHTPGASEVQIIRNDFTCTFCGAYLKEEKSQRIIADRVLCEMIQTKYLCSNQSLRDQAIPLHVRVQLRLRKDGSSIAKLVLDGVHALTAFCYDLASLVELGQHYEGIGIIRRDIRSERIVKTIEVNSMKKIELRKVKEVPEPINLLLKEHGYMFPFVMAYLFGGHICPPGTYIKLKLAIILSLLCDTEEKDRPLHILAIGKDTSIIHKLLTYGQRFTRRAYVHSCGQSLTAKVTNDQYIGAKYYIEGGSLLLARDGICYIGELTKFKKSSRDNLQSVLNSGKISVDLASKFTDGLPHTVEILNHSQIWAFTEPNPQGKSQQFEDIFTGCDSREISKVLLDSFSILQYTDVCDITTNEEVALHTAHQILQDAIADRNTLSAENYFSHDDLLQFIQYAKRLQPSITTEADKLIQGYFIASRKARNVNNSSVNMPMLALPSLLSSSKSIAKFNLHGTVTERDALTAIWLYEESMTARYGHSVLSVLPSPHVPALQIQQYFSELDQSLQQFHVNLLRLCTTQSSREE